MGVLRNLREVARKLRYGSPKPRFCPRCGSSRLRLSSRFDVWLLPEQYVCLDCGYKGPIVVELEREEEK